MLRENQALIEPMIDMTGANAPVILCNEEFRIHFKNGCLTSPGQVVMILAPRPEIQIEINIDNFDQLTNSPDKVEMGPHFSNIDGFCTKSSFHCDTKGASAKIKWLVNPEPFYVSKLAGC